MYNIYPNDSMPAIRVAIRNADFDTFQHLIVTGQATPRDQFGAYRQYGERCSWRSRTLFQEILGVLRSMTSKPRSDFEDKSQIPSKFPNLLNMARWLAVAGADCGDCGDRRVLEVVTSTLIYACDYDSLYHSALSSVVEFMRLAIDHSESNILDDYRGNFSSLIKHSAVVSLIMGQNEWDISGFENDAEAELGPGALRYSLKCKDFIPGWVHHQEKEYWKLSAGIRHSPREVKTRFGRHFLNKWPRLQKQDRRQERRERNLVLDTERICGLFFRGVVDKISASNQRYTSTVCDEGNNFLAAEDSDSEYETAEEAESEDESEAGFESERRRVSAYWIMSVYERLRKMKRPRAATRFYFTPKALVCDIE